MAIQGFLAYLLDIDESAGYMKFAFAWSRANQMADKS